MTIFSIYVVGTRLGAITFLFLTFALGLFFINNMENKKAAIAIFISIFIGGFTVLYMNIKTDKRWQTLFNTIPIALQTEKYKYWLDRKKYKKPLLPNGKPINDSNYLRPAQLKVASELFLENPLGVGFGRRAYKHALLKKYGEGHGHPHSGLLNLAIGVGIIGTIFWILFSLSLIYFGYKRYIKYHSIPSLILFFIVIGFNSRSFIDMTFQNHNLVMFMMLAGLLSFASLVEYEKA